MIKSKKTKIIATLGPASDSPEMIAELIDAGVNIFRFNTKHATIDWHSERIERVQKVADRQEEPIGILLDLQGPEIRIETKDEKDIKVSEGERIVVGDLSLRDTNSLCLPHAAIFEVLRPNDKVLIADGLIELKVLEKSQSSFIAEVIEGGVIKHRKGVNVPGRHLKLPSLIDDDLKKLDAMARQKIDFIALSFTQCRHDLEILRDEMKRRNIEAQVVAKIESQEALNNIDEIIKESDAIMIARGDLGVEVPIEELVFWQNEIITKCRSARKSVIVATQMLESMTESPLPTRAEATDVANAVFDGTDALMLSGETASGKYPVRAVKAMAKIAKFNEDKTRLPNTYTPNGDYTEMIVNAAIRLIETNIGGENQIDAAIVVTQSGYTAKVLSSYRPAIPIIAVTGDQKITEILNISYGVLSFYTLVHKQEFLSPQKINRLLQKEKLVKKGQNVVIIHGKGWYRPGLNNMLAVYRVGD